MAQIVPAKKQAGKNMAPSAVDEKILIGMYRNVYATRQFELQCIELYRQGLIRGYLHLYLGEEAVAAGACASLEVDDYIVSTHRGHGHCISKGADLKLMAAEIMGKATGYCGGRGGSMHISSKATNNLGANGVVGAGIPIGCGAAMGIKVKGGTQVVVVFFSDGASNQGVFGESLNFAAVFKLPVIFMLENNHYAVSTPVEFSTGCCELSKIGPAHGVPGICVDGNDAVAVYRETLQAVERARSGEGPTLIEAVAAIGRHFAGATKPQQNPFAKGSLAWLAWIVARLGGWHGYYKRPGPKTMRHGWDVFAARLQGYAQALDDLQTQDP